tara:strand:+ start:247 stop:453 length:207 start_codon:yes stop_codon:yes gene_type:complete
MKTQTKIVLTTFTLFMAEAIIHYNIGKKDEEKKTATKGFLPPTKSLIKIAALVAGFSILNGLIWKRIK